MSKNTEWFKNCGWGVFTHYLANKDTSAEEWNKQVNNFDVKTLSEQLKFVGAKYYFITIGQNSGHYCAPNSTYDDIVGIKPSKCSNRDLIAALYEALNPKGIRLLVYLPSGAPAAEKAAMERLEWEWGFEGDWPSWSNKRTGKRLVSFQKKWEAVIREWSLRWGNKICGWWLDGCYFADEMYRHKESPNFESFAKALKAGNPDSIVAFNPGVKVPVISHTEYEDYTAGEISNAFPVCPGSEINGVQYHILSFLGESWGKPPLRFPDEFVIGYTKHIISKGAVITWDVPIQKNGLIPEMFLKQLKLLSEKDSCDHTC